MKPLSTLVFLPCWDTEEGGGGVRSTNRLGLLLDWTAALFRDDDVSDWWLLLFAADAVGVRIACIVDDLVPDTAAILGKKAVTQAL